MNGERLTRVAARLYELDISGALHGATIGGQQAVREIVIELLDITDCVLDCEELTRPQTMREMKPIDEIVGNVVRGVLRRKVV